MNSDFEVYEGFLRATHVDPAQQAFTFESEPVMASRISAQHLQTRPLSYPTPWALPQPVCRRVWVCHEARCVLRHRLGSLDCCYRSDS